MFRVENLQKRYGEIHAVDRTLEQVGLEARAKDAVSKYSGGMKRRLNLALGHRPRAVLLDEPTVGLVLLVVSLCIATAGLSTLLGAVLRSPEQAGSLG